MASKGKGTHGAFIMNGRGFAASIADAVVKNTTLASGGGINSHISLSIFIVIWTIGVSRLLNARYNSAKNHSPNIRLMLSCLSDSEPSTAASLVRALASPSTMPLSSSSTVHSTSTIFVWIFHNAMRLFVVRCFQFPRQLPRINHVGVRLPPFAANGRFRCRSIPIRCGRGRKSSFSS